MLSIIPVLKPKEKNAEVERELSEMIWILYLGGKCWGFFLHFSCVRVVALSCQGWSVVWRLALVHEQCCYFFQRRLLVKRHLCGRHCTWGWYPHQSQHHYLNQRACICTLDDLPAFTGMVSSKQSSQGWSLYLAYCPEECQWEDILPAVTWALGWGVSLALKGQLDLLGIQRTEWALL